MSVDVIAGVMGAVDQSQATARFQVATANSKDGKVNQTAFGNLMKKLTGSASQLADAGTDHGLYGGSTAADTQGKKKGEAMVKLEGALLTKMVDQMMPKAEQSGYGQGLAGDTWRSFAVEQMGKTLAKGDLLNFNRKTETVASVAPKANLFGQGYGEPNEMKITPFAGDTSQTGT